ncbi:MAG TPA: PGPGW domain-containing protein [Actinomycetota bacterium]|nr:PGPGW domain-containing protein [Actinomycetota bacterium]
MDLQPLAAIVRYIGRSGKRIAVTVVGFVVLGAGLVMMVTPGPGIVVILVGLAILATEWAWAERALDRAKQTGSGALRMATASPLRIALSVAATLAGIAVAVVIWLTLT